MTSSTAQPIRIVLVDDHPVVRDGLVTLIGTQDDLHLVAEAASGEEALAMVHRHRPDLVITDLRMSRGDGIALIRSLRTDHPRLPILVLSTFGAESDVLPALRAGATGYLLKDVSRHELFSGIRATSRGETILSPAVSRVVVQNYQTAADDAAEERVDISPRELEILNLVAAGRGNREIGRHLHISEATVKTHLVRLYAKLGASDRASAVAVAYQRQILFVGAPRRDERYER